ncbi:MAG: PAS domain S-box protein, partial [Gammaproteobacteria bacterium]|nr:PAS domain S-box protein [Gammaproteobacteria bacterium]
DRKRAEQSLREGQRLLNAAERLAHVGAWAYDVAMNRFRASEEWRRMHGAQTPSVSLDELLTLVHREDRPTVVGEFERAIERGLPCDVQYRIIRGDDGAVRHIHAYAEAVRDTAGSVIEILGATHDVTDAVASEHALRTSEQHYRTIVETAQEGIWKIGPDARTEFINARMTEMLGYGAEELIGRSLFEFMDDEWRARAHAHFERRRAGHSDRHEFKFRRRDGSALWTWVSTNPIVGVDGRFAGALAMITDLTARKLVEDTQAFLLSCGLPGSGEDFFQSLARYIAQVLGMEYVCIDRLEGNGRLATTVAVYNDGEFESNVTYALKDTPCGAVLDQSVCCFPRDVQQLFGKDAVLRELQAESYIGTVLWDSKGQPIGLIAVIGRLPMTKPREGEALLALVAPRAAGELERREAERSLRESEERMRLALQATHDVIWDWDAVNDAQHWSSAGSRIFGWPDIVERPQTAAWWLGRVHPLDRERVAEGFHAAVGNPAATHWEDEYRFKCGDGRYALVYDRGYVLRDDAGHAVRMIGAMLDITARKEVEEELEAYRHHLEELVQQRTAELSASE